LGLNAYQSRLRARIAQQSRELEFEYTLGSHTFRCGKSLPVSSQKVGLSGQIRGVWASPLGLLWGTLPFDKRGTGPILPLAFRRPRYLTACSDNEYSRYQRTAHGMHLRQRWLTRTRRCLCAGPVGGCFPFARPRERFGKAIPGGYVGPIQLLYADVRLTRIRLYFIPLKKSRTKTLCAARQVPALQDLSRKALHPP
jgi:hypothetical protein